MSFDNEQLTNNGQWGDDSHIENPDKLKDIYHKLYNSNEKIKLENILANIEEGLTRLSGVKNAKITYRLKSPISILKKYNTNEKYRGDWNKIKDLIGFMAIVETNNDINDVLEYFKIYYKSNKNKYSNELISDFRKINIRTGNYYLEEIGDEYDENMSKGYQTSNGYKSARVNLMIDDYPIEIQVKTQAQYVAHEATYDTIYKTTDKIENGENIKISDSLFPYFETLAHIVLNNIDKQSPAFEDLNSIYERNHELYEMHPDVFNNACIHFAGTIFTFKYGDEIINEYSLGSKVLNHKLLSYDIMRLFKMIEKKIQEEHPEYSHNDTLNKTIQYVCSMDYNDFKKLRNKITKNYRIKTCLLTGVFDDLTPEDIDFIDNLNKSFHNVIIGVYNDELAELFLGEKPKFTDKERAKMMSCVKGVHAVHITDSNGQTQTSDILKPYHSFLQSKKTYDTIYLPLGSSVPTPKTIDYIEEVSKYTENLIIGIKSDQFTRIFEDKKTILSETERASIYSSIMGVSDVTIAPFDIIPPDQILNKLSTEAKNGKKVAIFSSSLEENSIINLKRKQYIDEYYPDIKFISLDLKGLPDLDSSITEKTKNQYEFEVYKD